MGGRERGREHYGMAMHTKREVTTRDFLRLCVNCLPLLAESRARPVIFALTSRKPDRYGRKSLFFWLFETLGRVLSAPTHVPPTVLHLKFQFRCRKYER
jgi:hypothetical protein